MKEAQDEAQYDEIRQKAEAHIWDQRDAQLKAQHNAREALMQQASLPAAAAAAAAVVVLSLFVVGFVPLVCKRTPTAVSSQGDLDIFLRAGWTMDQEQ